MGCCDTGVQRGDMKMHPMHSRKLLFRRGVSLMLGAGCITSWMMMTSYSLPRQTAAAPPGSLVTAAEAGRFLQQSTWGPTADLISHVQEVGFRRFMEEQSELSRRASVFCRRQIGHRD